jgi:hypothetical protein
VLTFAVARELFQAIAGRRAQVVQIDCGIQVAKLATSHLDQIGREAFGAFALGDSLSQAVPVASDHDTNVSRNDTGIKIFVSENDTDAAGHRVSARSNIAQQLPDSWPCMTPDGPANQGKQSLRRRG